MTSEEVYASQYNTIQDQWVHIRSTTVSIIEKDHVRSAVSPFVNGARVLDLACGQGFYTFDMLRWGARSAVGVDLSPEMIATAKRTQEKEKVDNVRFLVADISQPVAYDVEPFDLVFGAWPLEYAPDQKALVRMFENISLNLKQGGVFVSVVWHPSSYPRELVLRTNRLRPEGNGGVHLKALHDVDGGVVVELYGKTPSGDYSFESVYWLQEVYESAAKEGGMKGKLEWIPFLIPAEYLKAGQEVPGGASLSELQSYATAEYCAFLRVAKS